MRMCAAALVATLAIGAMSAQAANPLAEQQWRHRVLLLYVPNADAQALATFRERVRERSCGVRDRDLLIGEVVGRAAASLGEQTLSPQRGRSLRREHDVAVERVATVLVGKDGRVKMVADGVADLDRVFQRIDRMPMRRREMAERERDPCT